MKENRPKAFRNSVLMEVYGSKTDEVVRAVENYTLRSFIVYTLYRFL
jgi:hypothetical protein